MSSLLGDGWFYISIFGFLSSLSLFLYFLGLYRSAFEEAEDAEEAPEDYLLVAKSEPLMATAVEEDGDKKEEESLAMPAPEEPSVPEPEPEPEPMPVPEQVTAPPPEVSDSSSPAIVFLQDIKSHLDQFENEFSALKGQVDRQEAQGNLVIARLAELAQTFRAMPASSPTAEPVPRPAPVPEAPPSAPAADSVFQQEAEPVVKPRKGPVWPV